MNTVKTHIFSDKVDIVRATKLQAAYIRKQTDKFSIIFSNGLTGKYSKARLRKLLTSLTPTAIDNIMFAVPSNFKGNMAEYSTELLDMSNLYVEMYKEAMPKFIDTLSNIHNNNRPGSIFDKYSNIDLKAHLKLAKYFQGDRDTVSLSSVLPSKSALIDLLTTDVNSPLSKSFLTSVESDVKVIKTLIVSISHSLDNKINEKQRRTLKYIGNKVNEHAELISIIGSLTHQKVTLEYSLNQLKDHILTIN